MQSALSRIWTQINNSISYDFNSYTKRASSRLTQPLHHKQHVTQGQFFFNKQQLVWIQNFPNSWLDSFQKQENPVCSTIHL